MLNARNVGFKKTQSAGNTGNYDNLQNFVERRLCMPINFAQSVTVANSAVALLPSTILPGIISLGTTTIATDGGVSAAVLSGSVGTPSTNIAQDANGDIWNLVEIRSYETHDPIKNGGWRVYGLIQADISASDGDTIGGLGSENLQMTFVKSSEGGTLTSVQINGNIEFQTNLVFSELNLPAARKLNGVGLGMDIVAPQSISNERRFEVTSDFMSGEIITLATGAGAGSGISTPTGDIVVLSATGEITK